MNLIIEGIMSGIGGVFNSPAFGKFKRGFQKAESIASQAITFHATVLNVGRSVVEPLIPFTKIAVIAAKVLYPFRAIALLTMPFDSIQLGANVVDLAKAPGKYKFYPILKITDIAGKLLETASSALFLSQSVIFPAIEMISFVAAPILAVGVALQTAGVAATSWSLYKLCTKWKKVNIKLGVHKDKHHVPTPAEYKEAVEYLTPNLTTKKHQFKEGIFGVLSVKQKEKLKKLYDKCVAENSFNKMKDAFDDVRYYVRNRKAIHLLNIAITITAIAGVVLLLASPAFPIALIPIGWALVAIASVGGIMVAAFNAYNSYALSRSLDQHLK